MIGLDGIGKCMTCLVINTVNDQVQGQNNKHYPDDDRDEFLDLSHLILIINSNLFNHKNAKLLNLRIL